MKFDAVVYSQILKLYPNHVMLKLKVTVLGIEYYFLVQAL